jgi:nicotinic acid mononucleotide adenylyltransferase
MEYSDHGHLALIAQRIAELELHIARQRKIVAVLEEANRGSSETAETVREAVRIMERNLECEIRDRKRTRARMRK